ncbi:histidine phosphatase family protein [Terriglobus sp. RCC_193]|uniref:histidine phosphatase family protein n=1 Tax=Terriglobus sp. RCC_193 TaxID=3239218 RepID=UPI0035239338
MTEQKKKQAELWLFRHGETEWSLNGKHTSYTDLPLTEHGREQATALAPVIAKTPFDLVLTSPRQRARDTAALAGLGDRAEVEPNLQEWNYGVYEGKSTPEIQATEPGWSVWADPITGGESIDQVAARAQQVIDRCLQHGGRCALFAHAHIFRILAAVWVQQPGVFGQRLTLSTATVSVLGWEHGTRVITRWNAAP